YLVNAGGQVLWSEPPDQDLIETRFQGFDEITKRLGSASDVVFLPLQRPSGLEILIAAPLTDPGGRTVGMLIGAIPNSHPSIHTILQRSGPANLTARLVDEQSKLVIADMEQTREAKPFEYPDPARVLLVAEHAPPSPWTIVIEQNVN